MPKNYRGRPGRGRREVRIGGREWFGGTELRGGIESPGGVGANGRVGGAGRIGRPRRFGWLRREVLVLFFAVGDRRTPLRVRLLVGAALFYLIDPIDLIPDMIPLVGYLDDLIIVPLVLHLAFRWLPPVVREDSLLKAERQARRIRLVLLVLLLALLGMLVGMFFLGKEMAQHFR